MKALYPLRFRPILRRHIWGGRRLGSLLGKEIGPEDDYAESWEICDRGPEQTVLESGPLAGVSLGRLVAERGAELLGRHHPKPRFPLLMKFLDATQPISVQVHPDDAQAALLNPPDLGKSEAWVVLSAEPGSTIYAGLRPGVDRKRLENAIRNGTCRELLHQFQPNLGDCVYLPAGTVHALGKGLMVAEIQQSSDVTYRLFDWNRLGPDGKLRPLHVQQGLEATDFDRGPIERQQPRATDRPGVNRLVECDKFILDRWQFDSPQSAGGDQRAHIICVLEGSLQVRGDPTGHAVIRGRTVLLPAVLGEVELSPQGRAVLLDAYLP